MQIKYIVGIAVLTALITTLALMPKLAQGFMASTVQVVFTEKPTLTPTQIIWLARLINCESGGKAGAINPNDLDNTPSYGLLQFKPSTYAQFAKKYNLASTTDYMNPEGQVAIVQQWILDGQVRWQQQFPACVAKFGLPPQYTRN